MKAIRGIAAAGLLVLGGCAQAGGIGDILGGVLGGQTGGTGAGSSGTVVAEVQRVDTRNAVIEVETEDRQRVDVRYDEQTRVIYRQQEYEVTALEPGDVIRMSLSR